RHLGPAPVVLVGAFLDFVEQRAVSAIHDVENRTAFAAEQGIERLGATVVFAGATDLEPHHRSKPLSLRAWLPIAGQRETRIPYWNGPELDPEPFQILLRQVDAPKLFI